MKRWFHNGMVGVTATTVALTGMLASSSSLATAGASTAPATAATVPANVWPEYHHDATLDGTSGDPLMSASKAATLGVRWMANTGAESYSSPIVAWNSSLQKTVAYVGNEAGTFSAFDTSTGLPLWSTHFTGSIRSTPLAEGNFVWVAPAASGRIYKVNAATGAVACSAPVTNTSGEGLDSSPVLATPPGGVATVYMAANDVGSYNGPITAVTESTCMVEWAATPELAPGTGGTWDALSYGLDAGGNGLLVLGTADPDSAVYALNAVTGATVWRFAVENPSPSTYDVGAGVALSAPGVNGFGDGVAYVLTKYGDTYALDLTTGAQIWKVGVGSSGIGTPAVFDNTVVEGTDRGLVALNATTGASLWTDASGYPIDAAPAVIGPDGQQFVAYGDTSGAIKVVDPGTGAPLYSFQTGNFIVGSVADYDGNLLETSADGFLYDLAPGGGNGAAPSATVTAPSSGSKVANPNGPLAVNGTASGPSGVSGVSVYIQSGGSSGPWWNSSTGTWTAAPYPNPATLDTPGANSVNWSATFPVSPAGNVYEIFASAVAPSGLADNSINSSAPSGARSSFTVQASSSAPKLTSSAFWAAPGQAVNVSGRGFSPGEAVTVSLAGSALAHVTANSNGGFGPSPLKIPATALFGPGSLNAVGAQSGSVANAAIYVTNAWSQVGDSATQTSSEPNDSTFSHHLSVSSSTYLTRAWTFNSGAPITSQPAVVHAVAYAGNSAGQVFAVDVRSGQQVWQTSLGSNSVTTSPAFSGGSVVVGTSTGAVVALKASTGARAWTAQVGSAAGSVTVSGSDLLVGTAHGAVYALAAATGALLWHTAVPGAVVGAPASDGSLVLVGDSSGAVSALHVADGTLAWTFRAGGAVTSPLLSGSNVYVGSADGNLYDLAESTGSVAWSFATGAPVTAAPALEATSVVVGSSNGSVYYLKAGSLTYTVQARGAVVGVGAAAGFVVSALGNGSVLGSKPQDTDPQAWTAQVGTSLTAAPTILNGAVYVAGQNGTLACFTVPGSPAV